MIVKVFLALSMGNEPVSYITDQLEVLLNKEVSKGFENGLSVKMFRHIDQTALWCSLFKSRVLLASRSKACRVNGTAKLSLLTQAMVWIEELNENEPLLRCRK
jgi:hypothetical protein